MTKRKQYDKIALKVLHQMSRNRCCINTKTKMQHQKRGVLLLFFSWHIIPYFRVAFCVAFHFILLQLLSYFRMKCEYKKCVSSLYIKECRIYNKKWIICITGSIPVASFIKPLYLQGFFIFVLYFMLHIFKMF